METITEQHHEHLTEEEKKVLAQIRSVATTLYEKVDLDKPTVEFLREHFYKDPTLALAYFNCCSTDPCMAIFNDKLQPDVDGPEGRHNCLPQQQCASRRILLVRYELIASRSLC
jgi:hypothetical protein